MKDKGYPMKMAKAKPEDINNVIEFFQMVEEIEEYGTYTPENPDEEDESIEVRDAEQYVGLIKQLWPRVDAAWARVVMGYEMLLHNCCDPNADTLEWKPEIAERIQDLTGSEADG